MSLSQEDDERIRQLIIKLSDFVDASETGKKQAIKDSLLRLTDGLNDMKSTEVNDISALNDVLQFCSEEWINNSECIRVLAALSATRGNCFPEWLNGIGTDIIIGLSGIICDEQMIDNEDNWILLSNCCLESKRVTDLVMDNLPIQDLPSLIYDCDGGIRYPVLFLINSYCKWLDDSDIDEMLDLILRTLETCYGDEPLANELLMGLMTLRKGHEILNSLFLTHQFDEFCETVEPDPASDPVGNPRALCFILDLHCDAIQNGIRSNWSNWGRIRELVIVEDLPDNIRSQSLWLLWARAKVGDLPEIDQEMIDFLIEMMLNGTYDITKYAGMLLSLIIQKQTFEIYDPKVLIDRMCELLALCEYDEDFCAECASGLVMLRRAFPDVVDSAVEENDLLAIIENTDLKDLDIMCELAYCK